MKKRYGRRQNGSARMTGAKSEGKGEDETERYIMKIAGVKKKIE